MRRGEEAHRKQGQTSHRALNPAVPRSMGPSFRSGMALSFIQHNAAASKLKVEGVWRIVQESSLADDAEGPCRVQDTYECLRASRVHLRLF